MKFQYLHLCSSSRTPESTKQLCQYFASKYKGVSFVKQSQKYVAQIHRKGKNYHLGMYILAADGAMAYDVGAKVLKGSDGKNKNFMNDTEYITARDHESSQRGLIVSLTDVVESIKVKKRELRSKIMHDNPSNKVSSAEVSSILQDQEDLNASKGTTKSCNKNLSIEVIKPPEHQKMTFSEANMIEKLHKLREINETNTQLGVLAAIAAKVDKHPRPEASLGTSERIKKKTRR